MCSIDDLDVDDLIATGWWRRRPQMAAFTASSRLAAESIRQFTVSPRMRVHFCYPPWLEYPSSWTLSKWTSRFLAPGWDKFPPGVDRGCKMWAALFGAKTPENEHSIRVMIAPGWNSGFIEPRSMQMPNKWLSDTEQWEAVNSLAWQGIIRSIEECLHNQDTEIFKTRIRCASESSSSDPKNITVLFDMFSFDQEIKPSESSEAGFWFPSGGEDALWPAPFLAWCQAGQHFLIKRCCCWMWGVTMFGCAMIPSALGPGGAIFWIQVG